MPSTESPQHTRFLDIIHKINRKERVFLPILEGWAISLPDSEVGIVDSAAGLGIEGNYLQAAGLRVLSQDISFDISEYAGNQLVCKAEELALPDSCASGILLKDVWILLSPIQRRAMLREAKRILVPNGSVFIKSEIADEYRAIIKSNQHGVDCVIADNSFTKWMRVLNKYANTDSAMFEYVSNPDTVEQSAALTGLVCTTILSYDSNSELAQEGRFNNYPGFISVLTKQ